MLSPGVYLSSTNGPEPTTSPRHRSSGVALYDDAARIARLVVEVPCRKAALGFEKWTSTVSPSTAVAESSPEMYTPPYAPGTAASVAFALSSAKTTESAV